MNTVRLKQLSESPTSTKGLEFVIILIAEDAIAGVLSWCRVLAVLDPLLFLLSLFTYKACSYILAGTCFSRRYWISHHFSKKRTKANMMLCYSISLTKQKSINPHPTPAR